MLLEIRSNTGEVKIVAAPSDNDRETAGIQQDSALSLSFTAFECVALDVYDYVDFLGRRYILTEAYMPQMNARGEWAYSVKFSGVEALAAQTLMVNPTDGTDNPVVTLTAPAAEHAALIVANLNRRTGSSDWQVGEVIETPYLDIDYTGKNAAEAVAALAEAAGTEWWYDAMTLNICRCEFGEPIELEYGGILLGGIKRGVADGADFFTRLFPIGSSRNIDVDKYGHARLQLPDGSAYVDSRTELGIIERFEEDAFAGIYPRRIGTVGAVRSETRTGDDGVDYTVWFFTDPDLPFNPNDYEIGGLVKNVTFQTGELRGRVFEVNYDTRSGEFEIITQWPYDNGVQLPTPPMIPASGDEYILWNISMPESYYPAAEQEYAEAVAAFIADRQKDVSVFTAPTDYTVATPVAGQLRPGRRVRIKSEEYFPETGWRETRIISVSRSVANVGSMTLTMSDVLSSGRIQAIESGLNEVRGATSKISSSLSSKNESLARKLDKSAFYDLFEKVNIGTTSEPKYAIRAKYGLFSDSFLSALGLNPGMGGGEGGGATALSELNDVKLSGLLTGDALIYDGTHWVNRPQSSIVPDLSEYATRAWVQQQGYATSAALAPYITTTTANATFATKLGVSGAQIGTYVNGVLGNLITVSYATNADTVDGLHKTDLAQAFYNVGLDANNYNNFPYVYGGKLLNASNAPYNYYAFLHFGGGDYYAQFNAYGNRLQFRASKEEDFTPAWKTIAFTDSNVASATKLETARTLWGQSFDGTGNVSGDMTDVGSISASGELKTTAADAFRSVYGGYGAFFRNDGEGFYLMLTDKDDADGTFNAFRPLYIQFETGTVRIGSGSVLTVQNAGTIGIGTTTPIYKLDIAGEMRVQNRIYFGDATHYIELDSDGYFHFSHGVYSDEFLSVKDSNPDAGGGTTGATALSELTDVSLTALASGQLLMYNGSKWTNVAQSSIVPTLKALTFGSKTYNGTTAQTITAADLGALTSHQPIYALSLQAGAFSTKTYTPNVGAQTVNIPTNTSHLSNDSGFITSAALAPYITTTTANATFATKLGVSGAQIGTYVNGVLGNLITVSYATNADTVDGLHKTDLAQAFYNVGLDANNYNNFPYVYGGKLLNASNAPYNYYAFLHFGGGDYYAQFNAYGNRLQFRASKEEDFTPAWKTIAFTDSNVASATKLETARTLWGQSFNGESNVSGNMTGVGSVNASGEIITTSPNAFRMIYGDYGTFFRQDETMLYLMLTNKGNQSGTFNSFRPFLVELATGTVKLWGSAGLTVVNGGNVGVGNSNPAYKLDVTGVVHATTGFITETDVRLNNRIYFKGTDHYIEVDANGLFHFSHGVYTDGTLAARGFNNSGSTISLWGNTYDGKNSIDGVIRSIYAADPTEGTIIGKFLAKKSDPLGLILRTYTNGAVSLQSQRENDNLKRFVLALNPLGGNVAINQTSASYTLDVAGTIKASVDIIATGTVTAKDFIKPSDARLKTYMEDIELSVQDIANAPAWRYKWKSDESVDVGSTTQYWGAIVPELTHKLPDGEYYGLDYGKTALLSVIAVARTVQSHEERIAALERENEQLKQTLKKYIS